MKKFGGVKQFSSSFSCFKFYLICILFSGFFSMAGRQVHEVPPTNIGGSPFCLAVSFRGMDIQKVSLVILRCYIYIFWWFDVSFS